MDVKLYDNKNISIEVELGVADLPSVVVFDIRRQIIR